MRKWKSNEKWNKKLKKVFLAICTISKLGQIFQHLSATRHVYNPDLHYSQVYSFQSMLYIETSFWWPILKETIFTSTLAIVEKQFLFCPIFGLCFVVNSFVSVEADKRF